MVKKDFYIPQIEEDDKYEVNSNFEEETEKQKYQPEGFVSSLYGKNVKDNAYFHGVKYDNGGRQYDSFRDREKRVDIDDFKDYIIPKNVLQKDNSNQGNIQRNNIYKNNEPVYQEHIQMNNQYEEDPYYDEPVQKDEYVNVNNSSNYGYNNSNYGYNNANNGYSNADSGYSNANNGYSNANNSYSNTNNSYNRQDKERVNVIVDESASRQSNYQRQGNTNTQLNIKPKRKAKYVAPPLNVLRIKPQDEMNDEGETLNQRYIIDSTLKQFDVAGHVVNYTKGPTVTQFEVQLDEGVRNQKIVPLQSNLQGNLKATSLRMQIPIPGKATIGIEVPNVTRDTVFFGDMISNKKFLNDGNPLNVVLGVNIGGEPVYLDIPKMPHGLIAGSTGSGKSVCINAIIASILYKAHPDDVKLILVDPKRVEFARYSGIPHLATPIITEPKMANAALKWAVEEMENRYRLFEATGVTKYTEYIEEEQTDGRLKHIPYIVIIIDELADLMVTSGPEVEESIMRITQKARAAGIHLIVATQRPSVNIISGTIKTNIPTRIAFKVNKSVDSSIILDHTGAEKLLGLGDMLYTDDMGVENRIQGAFISTAEIKQVVSSLENYKDSEYLFTEEDLRKKTIVSHEDDALEDELFEPIARYVVENNTASINLLQKKFSCGFSRIQAIIIKLGELGVVSENLGSKAREVLVNISELEEILRNI